MAIYNAKDIYLVRSTGTDTFEEHPLAVQPNGIVATDSGSNLIMIPANSLSASATASYATNALTASYALNANSTSNILNVDGGSPDEEYGGTISIDGGTP